MVVDMSADDFLSLQDEIKRACALADEAARDCNEWQARRDELVRKSAGDLIHKVHENPLPAPAYEADVAHDELHEDELIDAVMEIVAVEDGKLRARIATLETEIEALQAKFDAIARPRADAA
jgi:hypothetical protein